MATAKGRANLWRTCEAVDGRHGETIVPEHISWQLSVGVQINRDAVGSMATARDRHYR
ncbi:MAG: hypothetical protein JO202_14555 [Ktedonobacteraceae bacterium]|nr:hypothetical protein [Ktedonobacteraceae bacterium]